MRQKSLAAWGWPTAPPTLQGRGSPLLTAASPRRRLPQALRLALPRPFIVTTAAWSIGAYGEGPFASSQPQGAHTGMALNMLRVGPGPPT